MSRHTYAGPYKNPTEGMYVKQVGERYEIWIRFDRSKDGSAPADRKHKSAPTFEEDGDAADWLQSLGEFYENDYDEYLEENHADIARMEAYEQFRNER